MPKKRVFIIHGWGEFPQAGWFPWIKKELEAKGFEVVIPQMPHALAPKINEWIIKIAEIVGAPDKDTYFIGHSLGCQAIARYLEALENGMTAGGAVFVAGFFKRISMFGDVLDVRDTVDVWLDTPIVLDDVKKHVQKSTAIFSDNDPIVPLDNQNDFRDKLGSRTIVIHHRGHYDFPTEIITAAPEILEEFLKITE
jgi:hypothetical protein